MEHEKDHKYAYYDFLRPTQTGEHPHLVLDGLNHMLNSRNFLSDSLFCEYAYVVNFIDRVLEF